jgi:hypothetical protein
MSDEKQPIRFYAVSYGEYSDYSETFVLATSPNDALARFVRSKMGYDIAQVGTVWEADLNENGIIYKSNELYEVELPGKYLWDPTGNAEVDKIDGDAYKYRCRLCGDFRNEDEPDRETFLNENRKCVRCANLRQIEK